MLSTELLCHRPDLRPLVSAWLLAEWPAWYGPGGPGDVERDVQAFGASPQDLPVGIVVFAGPEPVGFGALKQVSIPSHLHLSPWAAAGYVVPHRRGQGIGAALLQALVSHAASIGHPIVYCGTSTATTLLERSGWHLLEQVTHADKPLSIYRSGA